MGQQTLRVPDCMVCPFTEPAWDCVHEAVPIVTGCFRLFVGRLGQAYMAGYNCNTEEELQQVCGQRMFRR